MYDRHGIVVGEAASQRLTSLLNVCIRGQSAESAMLFSESPVTSRVTNGEHDRVVSGICWSV
jgi:hypothetical protein